MEAEATCPKQETICSPSLAQAYVTGVVDDTGQREVFTVPGSCLTPLLAARAQSPRQASGTTLPL